MHVSCGAEPRLSNTQHGGRVSRAHPHLFRHGNNKPSGSVCFHFASRVIAEFSKGQETRKSRALNRLPPLPYCVGRDVGKTPNGLFARLHIPSRSALGGVCGRLNRRQSERRTTRGGENNKGGVFFLLLFLSIQKFTKRPLLLFVRMLLLPR